METKNHDNEKESRSDRRQSWHFDKSINTSNLVAVVIAIGSLLIYQLKIDGSQDLRITLNAAKIAEIRASSMESDQRMQEQLQEIKAGMIRIENWLRTKNVTDR